MLLKFARLEGLEGRRRHPIPRASVAPPNTKSTFCAKQHFLCGFWLNLGDFVTNFRCARISQCAKMLFVIFCSTGADGGGGADGAFGGVGGAMTGIEIVPFFFQNVEIIPSKYKIFSIQHQI